MITIILSLWIIVIAVEVWRNYYLIEVKKTKPNYFLSFVVRGMAAILHGVFFDLESMREYWVPFIFQVTSFWIVFNPALNYFRKKPFFYFGKESGIFDRLFLKINDDRFALVFYIGMMVLCAIATTVLYMR